MTRRRLVDYIDRALWGWKLWRMRVQREREMPKLRTTRLDREACQKRHRAGAKAAEREAQAIMNANLRGVA